MFDRIFALILLIFLFPIFLIISILIIFEDGFPVLFMQKRVGAHGKLFLIYKFRSMKNNTPNVATHLLGKPKIYLLRIGNLIRKLSLDELPNLLNIVKGEMVFIGPRPALYNQYDLISKRDKCGVSQLKPGITGWAQVNGRDELTDDEKVFFDYEYLQKRTVSMNIKIIIQTILNVIRSSDVSH
jgi:O-antigen biosynthesis protein WbqP